MGTVTYKHQPAIEHTKGAIPLVGTSHLYTVTKMLWPDAVSHVLWDLLIPRSLHVCSGMSPLGDVRLDKNADNVHVRADAARLPFRDDAFASVLCDPPYNGEFQWNHDLLDELGRVAAERIIFQHWFIPATPDGRYKKAQSKFALSEIYVWQPQTYFGRAQLISVFNRTEVVQCGLFDEQLS